MKRINMNTLAAEITREEGGAISVSNGQVKEVMRLALEHLTTYPRSAVLELLERVEEEMKRRGEG